MALLLISAWTMHSQNQSIRILSNNQSKQRLIVDTHQIAITTMANTVLNNNDTIELFHRFHSNNFNAMSDQQEIILAIVLEERLNEEMKIFLENNTDSMDSIRFKQELENKIKKILERYNPEDPF
jgi:hypothetical protein